MGLFRRKHRKPFNKKQLAAMHSKGWSPIQRISKENMSVIPEKTGVYLLYRNKDRNDPHYVGVSKKKSVGNLQHRLQSYREKDDFTVHPTKRALRKDVKYFSYQVINIEKAREIEKLLKVTTKFNSDIKKIEVIDEKK